MKYSKYEKPPTSNHEKNEMRLIPHDQYPIPYGMAIGSNLIARVFHLRKAAKVFTDSSDTDESADHID